MSWLPAHPVIRRLLWVTVAFKIGCVLWIAYSVAAPSYADPDTWLHMVRVRELFLGGGWYDTAIPRDNAPFGTTTHWSRALDVLALPIVWGAQHFLPLRESLLLLPLWWNTLVLVGVMLPVALWLTGKAGKTPYAQGFVLAAVAAGVYFNQRQFDYHSLLATVCIGLVALAYSLSRRWESARTAVAMGVVAGFGVWVSVEFLFPTFLFMLWLACIWLRDGRLWPLWFMSLGLLAVLLAAFGLEQPVEAWGRVEHDSLSVVHVTAVGMNALCLGVLMRCNAWLDNARRRLLAGFAAAAAMLGALAVLFPEFWLGALSSVMPSLSGTYVWTIRELLPLYAHVPFPSIAAYYLGVMALPWCLGRARRKDGEADFYGLLGGVFCVMLVFMTFQTRWEDYVTPLAMLLLALWLGNLIGERRWGSIRARWTVLLLAFAPVMLASTVRLAPAGEGGVEVYPPASCVEAIEQAVRQDFVSEFMQGPQRVLIHENPAMMVLFYTPHSIIASNYHRNTRGILDLDGFMKAESEREAYEILHRRGVDVLLLCTPQQAAADDYPYLFALTHGAVPLPEWLESVPNPWESEGVVIFRTLFR